MLAFGMEMFSIPFNKLQPDVIKAWADDPWFGVRFVDILGKPLNPKFSYIFLNRAEYKQIDPNTDLIFDFIFWDAFNTQMEETNLYDIVCDNIEHFYDSSPFKFNFIRPEKPNYRELPFISEKNTIITYYNLDRR